jgi:molybdopterin-containing oxidoreductase family iron-sulfur binding subunit
MAVDLSRCTGCSACVTACYAENNIPTVGEEQVFRRREMSWMRIERYWEGGMDGLPLQARFSPVMCQHCNNAPCEPVCPVYAAYHTPDGLNGQVYNRCVGTRYCSNNCPFKVRYFNWLKFNEMAWPEPLNLQLNPDVTTRARGVMEKCTFCIQRIRGAQHTARLEDRDVRDGEVVTACAQACPSKAIKFGNVKDPHAEVVTWKQDHRGYTMLEGTNVGASVTYLAKVLNVEPAAFHGAEEH